MKLNKHLFFMAMAAAALVACDNNNATSGKATGETTDSAARTEATVAPKPAGIEEIDETDDCRPTGDIAQDAKTFMAVLYSSKIDAKKKEEIHMGLMTYYNDHGKLEEFKKAVDDLTREQ